MSRGCQTFICFCSSTLLEKGLLFTIRAGMAAHKKISKIAFLVKTVAANENLFEGVLGDFDDEDEKMKEL